MRPIVTDDSQVLILGTFPGPCSLELRQYYAHPRNLFWPIMAQLSEFNHELGYNERVQNLKNSGIAVWDVLESCEREGALDHNIFNPKPNDFRDFFGRFNRIEKVFFNGRKAQTLYSQLVQDRSVLDEIEYFYLPSTSPANARMGREDKVEAWKIVFE